MKCFAYNVELHLPVPMGRKSDVIILLNVKVFSLIKIYIVCLLSFHGQIIQFIKPNTIIFNFIVSYKRTRKRHDDKYHQHTF